GLSAGLVSTDNDLRAVPLAYLPYYTSSSGTSFAAPHIAGTIALMLQANPSLTVDKIKRILQQTATPMLNYSRYEVGAGCLNTYAAVRMAGLSTPLGGFRNNLSDPSFSYSREPIVKFNSAITPGSTYSTKFNVPVDAVFATVEVGWLQNDTTVSLLDATVSGPGKTISLLAPSALGLTASNKTGATINDPAPGNWTISVTNVSAPSNGNSQRLVVAVEILRANYSVSGLDGLSPNDRTAATRALRTGLISAP